MKFLGWRRLKINVCEYWIHKYHKDKDTFRLSIIYLYNYYKLFSLALSFSLSFQLLNFTRNRLNTSRVTPASLLGAIVSFRDEITLVQQPIGNPLNRIISLHKGRIHLKFRRRNSFFFLQKQIIVERRTERKKNPFE